MMKYKRCCSLFPKLVYDFQEYLLLGKGKAFSYFPLSLQIQTLNQFYFTSPFIFIHLVVVTLLTLFLLDTVVILHQVGVNFFYSTRSLQPSEFWTASSLSAIFSLVFTPFPESSMYSTKTDHEFHPTNADVQCAESHSISQLVPLKLSYWKETGPLPSQYNSPQTGKIGQMNHYLKAPISDHRI